MVEQFPIRPEVGAQWIAFAQREPSSGLAASLIGVAIETALATGTKPTAVFTLTAAAVGFAIGDAFRDADLEGRRDDEAFDKAVSMMVEALVFAARQVRAHGVPGTPGYSPPAGAGK